MLVHRHQKRLSFEEPGQRQRCARAHVPWASEEQERVRNYVRSLTNDAPSSRATNVVGLGGLHSDEDQGKLLRRPAGRVMGRSWMLRQAPVQMHRQEPQPELASPQLLEVADGEARHLLDTRRGLAVHSLADTHTSLFPMAR